MQISVKKLKETLESQKLKGLALDIDETLSFTISFWVKELNIKFGNPESLTASEIYNKYRLAQNVPYWQSEAALAWMERARKSNEIQEALPLIENSNKIVQKINKLIPIVAYITIRSESVIPGTKKWLIKHGFPEVPVIAKPDNLPYENGLAWKGDVLGFLYPQVAGIIDDTPTVVDNLPKNYNGFVFLYNNLNHQKKGKRIIPCPTWDSILEEVKNNFSSFPKNN